LGYPLPPLSVLRKIFKTLEISPDLRFCVLQSIDFKELFMQSLQKMRLSTPGWPGREFGFWFCPLLLLYGWGESFVPALRAPVGVDQEDGDGEEEPVEVGDEEGFDEQM
jgi:hypothetical protein